MTLASLLAHLRAAPLVVAKLMIRGYQLLISPLMGPRCRFYPCCSSYALKAFEVHGCVEGARLSTARILRCHPFSAGGYDPVPTNPNIRTK